jgi:hypothetical protein
MTTMNQEIAETYARQPSFYGGTFCVRCGSHFNLRQWVKDSEGTGHIEFQFDWLDERDGRRDGSFVGE